MSVNVCAGVVTRLLSDVLCQSLPYFVDRVSHWTQSSLFWSSWLASKTPGSTCLYTLMLGLQAYAFDPSSTWVLRIWTQVPEHALHIGYFPRPVSTILIILFIIYLIMNMSITKYNFIGNKSSISSNLVAIKCCYWLFCCCCCLPL